MSSLLPASDQQTDISSGQLLCGGLFSGDPVSNWLCSAALSHVFHDSDKMRGELLRVQLSTTPGSPPVPLLCQSVKLLQHTNTTNIATRCGILQLLCSWVASCPPAATLLLESQDSLSYLLNQIGSNEHDEKERLCHGLSAVLLGLCILHNENKTQGATAHDLTQLVQKRIGKDMFLGKIGDIPKHEAYIRALKSPQLKCASTADLLFDHMFCELFRSYDRDITNILSERSQTPQTNGEVETGDILQYKNFIREQDAKMSQFVEANNQLHAELTNVRALYEEQMSQIQILRDQNAILQAQTGNNGDVAPSPVRVTSSVSSEDQNNVDSLKVEDLEKQVRHKDEYIAELEARMVKEDADNKEKMLTIVAYNQSQTIEIQTLKKQLESMREIMMSKDEQIIKLKNDLPIKPKSGTGAPQDRFENMFMTSMELEAYKKQLAGVELEQRLKDLENLVVDKSKDIQDLTNERNTLEKELLDSRHRIDDLEDVVKNQGNFNLVQLETELRDAKCKIEELQEGRDSNSLQAQDNATLETLLRDAEQRLVQTRDQLTVSQQQVQTLSLSYEQLSQSQAETSPANTNNNDNSSEAALEEIRELKNKLEAAEASLKSVNSEQEDLLGKRRMLLEIYIFVTKYFLF